MKKEEIIEYLNPDYIYLPYDKVMKKKLEDEIYFEEIIGITENNDYLFSSVSGVVIKTCEVHTISGIKNGIVVENNYKDKRKKNFFSNKSIYSMKKDEITELLKAYNITFGKSVKLKVFYKNGISSDSLLFNEYIEEILELLDVFNTSFKKDISIHIRSNDVVASYALQKYKESYPSIKVIFDDKKEIDTVDVFSICNAYLVLKAKRLLTYKYITINYKNKIYNIKTKLYTKISDILKNLNINDYKDIMLLDIKNNIIKYNSNIIEKDVTGIIIK